MRDCVFLVADKTMRETFLGFLERQDRLGQLQCSDFAFEPNEDLFFAAGQNDPGLYTRADELLRPFQHTHHKVVVALDCEWEGSPGQAAIIERIEAQLVASGWVKERFIVLAIDPELEQWIWQDSPVLANELRVNPPEGMRAMLQARGLWPEGALKPPSPKEVFNQIRRENRVKISSSVFRRIASTVPVGACQDGEFLRLVSRLREWFPAEVTA